jgi:hypothetical protein
MAFQVNSFGTGAVNPFIGMQSNNSAAAANTGFNFQDMFQGANNPAQQSLNNSTNSIQGMQGVQQAMQAIQQIMQAIMSIMSMFGGL